MPFDLEGKSYFCIVGSDVDRDGMYLEVSTTPDSKHVLLEIFYSDETNEMTVSIFEHSLPLELIEFAISQAKRRLPPSSRPSR